MKIKKIIMLLEDYVLNMDEIDEQVLCEFGKIRIIMAEPTENGKVIRR